MLTVTLDMYQTLAVAVAALVTGELLKRRLHVLEKICIPSPVAGGLVFAAVACLLHAAGILEVAYTDTMQEICMVFFFTSVGYQADVKVLKTGGKPLVIFLGLIMIMTVAQNLVAVGTAGMLGLDPLVGMCTGSIPMLGGHGTSAAFGRMLESLGAEGATTIAMAAATYGLVAGSLMGGPLANRLVKRKHLLNISEQSESVHTQGVSHKKLTENYAVAAFQLVVTAGIGTVLSQLLSRTGLTVPLYLGAMVAAAAFRNLAGHFGKYKVYTGEIEDIGKIMLALFLGVAMVTLRLWDLASLAFPLVILLIAQTVFMFLFVRLIVFQAMGRDYDAAVISAGTCGFGMGATPNAMANMQAVTRKYGPSVKAYILIPIVGSLFVDICNTFIVTLFINNV